MISFLSKLFSKMYHLLYQIITDKTTATWEICRKQVRVPVLFLSYAGDGDSALKKQPGGLFLAESGAIYDCA